MISAAQARAHRRWTLRTRYGITPEEYDELLARQDGRCAMCREECATGKRLAVDHDHATGAVRGLLCHACNRALGVYERIKNHAEAYLASATA